MKKQAFLFLSASVIILTVALGLSSAYENRRAEIRDLERQLDQMHEIRRQLEDAEDRMADLEQMLLNLRRMQQLTGSLSRGGRLTLLTMPLTTPSGFTAERFDRVLASTGLAGLGQAFYGAEKDNGINALVLAAICAHESGWGTSRLARDKNNLAGIGAYDCSPGKAMCFDSREECVFYLARLLRDKPGDSLAEIGIWYASDPRWAQKVAGCMRLILERAEVAEL